MMDADVIEKEALKLDLQSRGRLASRLLRSLDDVSTLENEASWAEEAKSWIPAR